MAKRLTYRDLKCPDCGYSLEGLTQPVCPECGEGFDPDWLYSVDYAHAIQWTPRRMAAAWFMGVVAIAGVGIGAFNAGGEFVCMLMAVLGVGAAFVVRRLLL